MSDLDFFLEHGFTFEALGKAESFIVDGDNLEKFYTVIFNQALTQCMQGTLDPKLVFENIIHDFQERLNTAQTPQELFDSYGDREDEHKKPDQKT